MSTASSLGLNSFNPATLPLLSTSIGLFFALLQPTIFVPFLNSAKTDPKGTARALRLWWNNYFVPGLSSIASIGAGNLTCGIYALRNIPKDSQEWKIAALGLAFAMAHFLFAPKIGPVIQTICDEETEKKGRTIEEQKMWLRIHYLRMFSVDVPAVICFAWLVFKA